MHDKQPKQPKFDEMSYPSESKTYTSVEIVQTQEPGEFLDIALIHICMDEGCDDLIPTKPHEDDAGYDLKSKEDVTLAPMSVTLVHTGVHVCMHKKVDNCLGVRATVRHMLADVRSRSGLALKHGLFVLNSPGTIDQSYKGEICAIMFNTKSEPYQVKRGDRIAQLVFLYKPLTELYPVNAETFESLSTETDRGSGGFGSTGR